MDSPYKSTPQTTNAARVSRAVTGPCTDLFRDVLCHYIPQKNFPSELANNKKVQKFSNQQQKTTLYPAGGVCTATYEEFDISLLYVLIRNMCGIKPDIWKNSPAPNDRYLSANLDRVREIRNQYCGHYPLIYIPDSEFENIWSKLQLIMQEIEFEIHGQYGKFSNEMNFLKTQPMDPEQENYYLNLIDRQKEALVDISDKLEKQDQTIRRHEERQEEQGQTLRRHEERQEEQDQTLRRHEERQEEQDKTLRRYEEQQMEQDQTLRRHEERQEEQDQTLRRHEEQKAEQNQTLRRHEERHDEQDQTLRRHEERHDEQDQTLRRHEERHNKQDQTLRRHEERQEEQDQTLRRHDAKLKSLNDKDTRAANIKANTETVLKEHQSSSTYSETNAVNVAIERLKTTSIVIMTGKGGEGKTSASYQIMSRLSGQYTPVIIHKHNDWNKVINPKNNMIVLLDDMVGKTNFDALSFEKWQKTFPLVSSSAKQGKIYVIIGLRENILKEIKERYRDFDLFKKEYEINLSNDHKLTMDEKRTMMTKYELYGELEENYKNTLHSWDKKKILKSDPFFGFPQACHLFFTRKELFELGPRFFKHPDHPLLNDIERLRKSGKHLEQVGYCVLAYVFVYQQIDISKCHADSSKFKEITNTIMLEKNVIDQHINDAIEDTCGHYLSVMDNENIYTFSHETVLEAVLLSFGKLSPALVIERCSKNALFELIRTKNYQHKPQEVVLKIPQKCYMNLVHRLLNVSSVLPIYDFMKHAATDDADFAETLFSSHAGGIQWKSIYGQLFEGVVFEKRKAFLEVMLRYCRLDYESDGIWTDTDIMRKRHETFSEGLISFTDSDDSDSEREMNKSVEIKSLHNQNDDVGTGNDLIAFTDNVNPTNKVAISKRDLRYMLEECLKFFKKGAIILCQYINTLSDARDFYNYKLLDEKEPKTLIRYCVDHRMNDVADLILKNKTVTHSDICRWLDECILNANEKAVLILCRYINGLSNTCDYYERNVQKETLDTEHDTNIDLKLLHFCVVYGWENVVDVIPSAHLQTKTNKNWSSAHLAAFAGRLSLLKKFLNMGQCMTERTNEGYSVLQTFILGLRYIEHGYDYCSFKTYFRIDRIFFDVNESCDVDGLKYCTLPSLEMYIEVLTYLLDMESMSIDDIYLSLDRYGNNIVHYLVANDCGKAVDLLLNRCPGIFHYHNNTTLPTALHLAAYLGRYNMVHMMSNYIDATDREWSSNKYSLLHALILGLRYDEYRYIRYIDVAESIELYPKCRSSKQENYIKILNGMLSVDQSLIQDAFLPVDKYGNDITQYSIIQNLEGIIDVLLEMHPAMFYQRHTTTQFTALHLAAFLGRCEIVKKLWNARQTPSDENVIEGKTNQFSSMYALMLGLRYQPGWVCRYVDVEEVNQLHPICKHLKEKDYIETLNFIHSACPSLIKDIYLPIDKHGHNITHYIIMYKLTWLMDVLLQMCPEVFHKRNNTTLPTVLHLATYLGRYEMVANLWKAGIRPTLDDASLMNRECASNQDSLLYALMLGLRYPQSMSTYYRESLYIDLEENNALYPICISPWDEGYFKTLKFIISVNPPLITDFNVRLDRYGHNIAHYTIVHCRDKILDLLLHMCPGVFSQRNNTALPTALHLAVYLGQYEMVKKLWEAGIRPIFDNENPTDSACMDKQYSLLHALMLGLRYNTGQKTCYIDVKCNHLFYPERHCRNFDESYFKTFNFILSLDSSVITDLNFLIDRYGSNIVHYLVIHNRGKIFDSVYQKCPEIFHLRNGTTLPTALHLAMFLGRHKIATKLWKSRPTPFDENLHDNTYPTGQYSLLHALLLGLRYHYQCRTRYIDVDEKNDLDLEWTYSSKDSYIKTFQFILSVNSNLKRDVHLPVDKYGNNVTYYIIFHGNYLIFEELLQMCPELFRQRYNTTLPTALHLAVFLGRHEMVEKLWKAGLRLTPDDENLIDVKCARNQYSLLHTLMLGLRHNDNQETRYIDVECNTLLYPKCNSLSFIKGYNETLQFILSVDPSVIGDLYLPIDTYRNNIVHYLVIHHEVCFNRHGEIFDFLFQKCPDIIHLRNSTNLPTALHVAVYLGRNDLAKKLLEAGVRPERDDKSLIDTLRDGRQYSGKRMIYMKDKINEEYQWTHSYDEDTYPDIQLLMVQNTEVTWGSRDDFDAIEDLIDEIGQRNK